MRVESDNYHQGTIPKEVDSIEGMDYNYYSAMDISINTFKYTHIAVEQFLLLMFERNSLTLLIQSLKSLILPIEKRLRLLLLFVTSEQ